MPRRLARLLLVACVLGGATFVATVGVAQQGADGRNMSPDYFDAVDGARCFSCHAGQGFEPMAFAILSPYSQLEIDAPTGIELQIRHAGDLTQTLQDMAVTIDVSAAPNVQVLVDDFVPETRTVVEETLAHDVPVRQRLEVGAGAVSLDVSAEAESGGRPVDVNEELHVAVVTPDGQRFPGQGEALNKTVHMDDAALDAIGAGVLMLELTYRHPVPQVAPAVDVRAVAVVTYGQEQTNFRFPVPGGAIRGADPGNEKARTVTVPVVIRSADEALLDFRFEAVNFWEHRPQDDAPSDEGLFYRFQTMKVTGGDTTVHTSASTAAPAPATVDLYTLFTKLLGFTALLLVPMAMVTGGLFGKGSRRWLNRMAGGAKKRVLWHNAMSFMIIAVASLHFVLALVEPGLKWSKGLLWGGLGWAVLMSLGFTGWYQVRMIKRWNYRIWRHVHLWSAVSVFAFGALHMVLDGADLVFLRDVLPAWHDRLVWP